MLSWRLNWIYFLMETNAISKQKHSHWPYLSELKTAGDTGHLMSWWKSVRRISLSQQHFFFSKSQLVWKLGAKGIKRGRLRLDISTSKEPCLTEPRCIYFCSLCNNKASTSMSESESRMSACNDDIVSKLLLFKKGATLTTSNNTQESCSS